MFLFLIHQFALPLILTVLLESLLAFAAGMRERQFYLAMLWINPLTNISLNVYRQTFSGFGIVFLGYDLDVWILEFLIIIIEWGLLTMIFPAQSSSMLRYSALMNTGSFLFGIVLYILFD